MGKKPAKKAKRREGKASAPATAPVAIVIAPVHSAEDVETCIARVRKTTEYVKNEITVCAAPGLAFSAEMPASVRLVEAAGDVEQMNAGLSAAAEAELVALLDPCMLVEDGWLRALVKGMREQGVGIVGGRVLTRDGTLGNAGFVTDPVAGVVSRGRGRSPGFFEALQQSPLPAVDLGAALLTRATIDAVGEFDATLGSRWAGTDYCLRARTKGFRSLYSPSCSSVDVRPSARALDDADSAALLRELGSLDRFYSAWAKRKADGGRDEAIAHLVEFGRRFEREAAERLRSFGVTDVSRALSAGRVAS